MEKTRRVKIVTDSTCYLDPNWLSEHEVLWVPLLVNFDSRNAREGVDVENREFYAYLRTAKSLPTTSQPSAGDFAEVYRKVAEEGTSVISIHISGGISGTVNSAQTGAAALPNADITIVDSRTTGLGLGFMVREAVELAETGASKGEVLERLRYLVENVKTRFVVSDLMYLHKGGRIGGAAAIIGSALQIKPILHFRDGKIDVLQKVRTERRAFETILNLLAEESKDSNPTAFAIVHADAPEKAEEVASMVRSRFAHINPEVREIGPVIGTHTGPGLVGFQYYFG